jgi:hypothetical protein
MVEQPAAAATTAAIPVAVTATTPVRTTKLRIKTD